MLICEIGTVYSAPFPANCCIGSFWGIDWPNGWGSSLQWQEVEEGPVLVQFIIQFGFIQLEVSFKEQRPLTLTQKNKIPFCV